MFRTEFKNAQFIALLEEDNIPYVCGLKKNKDVFFSIKISIYKNANGRKSTLLSRYHNMWDSPVSKDAIMDFISNILTDVNFRENYRTSDFFWDGVIKCDFTGFNKNSIVVNTDHENKKKAITKPLKPIKVDIDFLNNLSLKLDILSLYISDENIKQISDTLSYRPAIIYAIKLVIDGLEIDKAIENSIKKFHLNKYIEKKAK